MLKQTQVFLLLIFTLLQVPALQAQDMVLHFEHPVLNAIERAETEGILTPEESLLQKIYLTYAPHLLMDQFADIESPMIRCFTPVMMEFETRRDQLSSQTIQEIEHLVQPQISAATQQHLSPSGRFILYYETDGSHAVPLEDTNNSGVPDYIEKAAFAADSSWNYQVGTLGFVDPVLPATPYEIYFRNLSGGLYGEARASMGTTYITIHSNFNGFPANDHPEGNRIGALYVTIAHEIKHAIQYATNLWRGEAGSFNWSEMDATMMEEITFDDVNDYYNYIVSSNSIFRNPQVATPRAYWHVTWKLYFAEVFGMEFWVDVWERFITNNFKPFREAMQETLDQTGDSLPVEHLKNHMWHMASGPEFSIDDFGFREREFYPNPAFARVFTSSPDSLPQSTTLAPFAARYYRTEGINLPGNYAQVTVDTDSLGIGIGLIALYPDGSSEKLKVINTESHSVTIETEWPWDSFQSLYAAIVSTRQNAGVARVQVRLGNIPFIQLLSPIAGQQNVLLRPLLTWSEYPEAQGFTLQIAEDAEFNSVVLEEYVLENQYTPDEPLQRRSVYYWRVQPIIDNEPFSWSKSRFFITGEETPRSVFLSQNYPNPFNPQTTIAFSVEEQQLVRIDVYDALGRRVTTLTNRVWEPGYHTVVFDGMGLASGLYNYRLSSNGNTINRRMTLIK